MAYEYSLLNESNSEIRLLTLFPGLFHFPLRGRLDVCRLVKDKETPPYEALSYHWSDPAPAASIWIDGLELPIARNLDVALRHLRYVGQLRVFWVDAVCINQKDVAERNRHLLAVNAVYEQAHRVVGWLGPGNSETDAILAAVGATESPAIFGARPRPTSAPISTASHPLNQRPDPDRNVVDINLDCILARPWWRRLWAVQEFVLAAKDPLIICGFKEVAWPLLQLAVREYDEQPRCRGRDVDDDVENENKTVGATYASRFGYFRQEVQTEKKWAEKWHAHAINIPEEDRLFIAPGGLVGRDDNPHALDLTHVLQNSVYFETTDPRDRIYACLGLMASSVRRALAPDYNKSVLQVYTDMSQQILATPKERFFSFFSFAQLAGDSGGQKSKDDNWPSWVPDWSQSHMTSGTPRDPIVYMDIYWYCDLGPRRRPVTIREEAVEEAIDKRNRLGGIDRSETSSRLVCSVAGFVFDTVDSAVQLQSKGDLVRQIVGPLHNMVRAADAKPLDPDHLFAPLQRDTDLVVMIGGGNPCLVTPPKHSSALLREQAELYGITLPPRYDVKNDKNEKDGKVDKGGSVVKRDSLYLVRDNRWEFAPTRWFFTTNLGFTGICVEQVVDGDVVTVIPGERVPIVLRPQPLLSKVSLKSSGTLYSVVGAAHVGAIQCNDLIRELCSSGKMNEVVFDLV
ncbi:hypothetical protein Sste5346_008332 [Sporothrix stenoceras]|uniref:Heterokaryon incompatibility domain-containing protein n=1 Tax=Sporothrix stenoceras TaxID=5173 RepID=A0ABR3YQR0_9PEZI